ncbi:MAG TPA: LysR family transcriptional regulator [Longimicrobiales bacterium]
MTRSNGPGAELPYIEVFRAVCEEGGFTAAARRLGISQPAVSYQVRRLEAVLGVRLLERTGRRVVLTAEGKRFRSFAERVVAELAQVRSECVAGARLEPLRLGSASGFGRYVLMPALRALLAESESSSPLEVRLQFEAADLVLDRLEAGEYEAAFVYKRRVTSALCYEAVYDEELVLVGSPGVCAEVRAQGLERLATLEAAPFVTYEECDYVFGRWFEASFGAQPSRVASRSHFTELEEVLDFVARGVGLSVVPRDAAAEASARGEVEVLYAGSGEPCYNPVYLVTRAGAEVRPRLRRLVELLGSAAAHR